MAIRIYCDGPVCRSRRKMNDALIAARLPQLDLPEAVLEPEEDFCIECIEVICS